MGWQSWSEVFDSPSAPAPDGRRESKTRDSNTRPCKRVGSAGGGSNVMRT
jgi:hypothetical protein